MVQRKLQSLLNYFGFEIRRLGTLSPTAIFYTDLRQLILGCSEAIGRYPINFVKTPVQHDFSTPQVNVIDLNSASILDIEEFLVLASQHELRLFKVENFYISFPDLEFSNG